MKTWEMIKELTENPEKKFKRIIDGLEIRNISGRFDWGPGHTFLDVNDEWEEVKEPVDFMTAIESGNRIKVKYDLMQTDYIKPLSSGYVDIELLFKLLSEEFASREIREIILNADWYIEQ